MEVLIFGFIGLLHAIHVALSPLFDLMYPYTRYTAELLILAIVYWVIGLIDMSKRMRFGLTLLAGPILIWLHWGTLSMSMFDSGSEYGSALLSTFRYVLANAPMVIGISVASLSIGATLCAMEVSKHRREKEPSEDSATGNTDREPQALTDTEAPGQQQNLGASAMSCDGSIKRIARTLGQLAKQNWKVVLALGLMAALAWGRGEHFYPAHRIKVVVSRYGIEHPRYPMSEEDKKPWATDRTLEQ